MQKHILLIRKIIFIVPHVTPGSKYGDGAPRLHHSWFCLI